jgi:hypothetical protein
MPSPGCKTILRHPYLYLEQSPREGIKLNPIYSLAETRRRGEWYKSKISLRQRLCARFFWLMDFPQTSGCLSMLHERGGETLGFFDKDVSTGKGKPHAWVIINDKEVASILGIPVQPAIDLIGSARLGEASGRIGVYPIIRFNELPSPLRSKAVEILSVISSRHELEITIFALVRFRISLSAMTAAGLKRSRPAENARAQGLSRGLRINAALNRPLASHHHKHRLRLRVVGGEIDFRWISSDSSAGCARGVGPEFKAGSGQPREAAPVERCDPCPARSSIGFPEADVRHHAGERATVLCTDA